MSSTERMTREQAIALVGIDAVDRVDAVNCEPTNRVLDAGDDSAEWAASVHLPDDEDGFARRLVAVYYTTPEQDATMGATGDGASIDWVVDHYEVR